MMKGFHVIGVREVYFLLLLIYGDE